MPRKPGPIRRAAVGIGSGFVVGLEPASKQEATDLFRPFIKGFERSGWAVVMLIKQVLA